MRSWISVAAVTGLLFGAGLAGAHEGDEPKSIQTITGEVVDMACYLSDGASGPKHQECAQKCITSGLPVGIKSGDQLYLAVTSEHGPANAKLASLASKQVRAEGVVSERNGVHLIAIKKVTVQE